MTLAQPRNVAREACRLAGDTVRIVAGKSARAPAKGDRRFADPAWSQNPAFRRLCQEYLSLCESASNLVGDLDHGRRGWQDAERARFVVNILMSALAPTNFLPTNPAALKRAFDTAGLSVAKGASQWWRDLRQNGGMPSQTDRSAFGVGLDLAVTPGAGLIISHGQFLHRDAFRRAITAGASICTGQPLAAISWDAALRALDAGLLPCASSEQAILRIAASLGDPAIPVHLRTVLGNLDTRNITLVASAITTANG